MLQHEGLGAEEAEQRIEQVTSDMQAIIGTCMCTASSMCIILYKILCCSEESYLESFARKTVAWYVPAISGTDNRV